MLFKFQGLFHKADVLLHENVQVSTQFQSSEMFLNRLLLLSTFSNLLKKGETGQIGWY